MPQRGKYPVIDAWNKIIDIIQTDSYLGSQFSFTNAKTNETDYRIYKLPLDEIALKGTSFSCWFKGDAPFNTVLGKPIPIFYLDVATRDKDISVAIQDAWKLANDVVETLRLDTNLDKTVENHFIDSFEPVAAYDKGDNVWTFILTVNYAVLTHGFIPY